MKVQINNLEALERLLGEDKEITAELKTNVVEAFAKKYIKTVAKEFEQRKFDKIVEEELYNRNGWWQAPLNQEVRAKIRQTIDKQVTDYAEAYVKVLHPTLEEKIDEIVKNKICSGVDRKIDSLMNGQILKKIQNALGNETTK